MANYFIPHQRNEYTPSGWLEVLPGELPKIFRNAKLFTKTSREMKLSDLINGFIQWDETPYSTGFWEQFREIALDAEHRNIPYQFDITDRAISKCVDKPKELAPGTLSNKTIDKVYNKLMASVPERVRMMREAYHKLIDAVNKAAIEERSRQTEPPKDSDKPTFTGYIIRHVRLSAGELPSENDPASSGVTNTTQPHMHKYANVPVATPTLVYGVDIADYDEGQCLNGIAAAREELKKVAELEEGPYKASFVAKQNLVIGTLTTRLNGLATA